jgi:hypothetical protein
LHYKAVPSSNGMTRLVYSSPINNTSLLPTTLPIRETRPIVKFWLPRRDRLQRHFVFSCA